MKQYPSRLKFKKNHKPKSKFLTLNEQKNILPLKGMYGLKCLQSAKLTFKQIEAGRRTLRRTTRKSTRLHIDVFPSSSITKKPISSRMGKGKGSHSFWMAPVRKGAMVYELDKINPYKSFKALKQAGSKLPVKTKIVRVQY